ncbi:MAG: hypothetical protein AAFN92_10185 [Bacteroidota bacterium]
MKTKVFALFLLCCFALTSCQDDDDLQPANPDCGPAISIIADPDSRNSDNFTITEATVDGLCLTVTLAATGCSTSNWQAEIVTDGAVAESLPTQSFARIILDDGVPDGSPICQAEVSRTFSFDLTTYLGDGGSRPSLLTLRGMNMTVTVE